ncbi:response regulator [bacterium]|nr:response regulator [bacterium]
MSHITDTNSYERQMFQEEKMNAVGRMAAGVAHDLNNVLFAIMGLSELLAPILPSGSKEAEYVGEIHAAGERAAKLVRQLLTIARRQPARVEIVDLNLLVGNLATFLERITGKAVNLSTRVAQSPARVKADPGQIEQVLMNLAINARDAMPEGGKLDISVDVIHLDEDEAFSQLDLQPGDYAGLGVSDTGCGMDKETLARVFEPFFTTKPPERGTGLGLTTTYGIVRQYGGAIHVYSEPGRGTTFRVYLPLTPEMEEAAKAAAAPAPQPGGTVLVVDDEEAVLRVVGAMLEEMGFAVLTATNAEAALECCHRQSPRLTLIVTDLVLPGLSGWDLATRLRRDYPHTPVLYMSGFANNMIFRDAEMGPLESYLEKPITPRALKEKVNELLGRASR